MRSPVIAMLWENWRLTRGEAAQRVSLGIVAGAAILAWSAAFANETVRNSAANWAFAVIAFQHSVQWLAIAKLNGGRFLEGYRPGFPFHLHFARPVRTSILVGVPMAYDAVSGVLLYLATALLLQGVFGSPLPLLPIVAWIVAFRLMQTAVQWATRNRVVQWITSIAGTAIVFGPSMYLRGFQWSTQIDFSLAEYALMASIGLASFGVAVAGVARQRRGDVWKALPRTTASTGYPDWFMDLFRLPCPTASATRAQVWFELKSTGLPVLAIGLAGALLHPILFALSGPIDFMRGFAGLWAVLSVLTVLVLGGNAFGIRWKQGRAYATAFMATQASGTARLAGLKVLVRTTCLLAALLANGVSLWTSSSLVSGWGQLAPGPMQLRRTFGTAIGALTGYELIALIAVAALLLTVMVAARASLTALRARYPRQLLIASSLLMLYGLAFVARSWGMIPDADEHELELLSALFEEMTWIVAFVMTVATVFLVWRSIADQLLTLRHVGGAILVSAAFGAAEMTLLGEAGLQLAGTSTTATVWLLLAALLPLTVSLLAPWSLSRIRHT